MSPEQLELWSVAVVRNDDEGTAAALEIARGPEGEESISSLHLAGLTLAELGAAFALALEIVRSMDGWERATALAQEAIQKGVADSDAPF